MQIATPHMGGLCLAVFSAYVRGHLLDCLQVVNVLSEGGHLLDCLPVVNVLVLRDLCGSPSITISPKGQPIKLTQPRFMVE